MARAATEIMRRLSQEVARDGARREREEYLHPAITKMTVDEANGTREFQLVGRLGIKCDRACYGANIPQEYSRVAKWGTIRLREQLPGYPEGYVFSGCGAYGDGKKICVTRDPVLEKALEDKGHGEIVEV